MHSQCNTLKRIRARSFCNINIYCDENFHFQYMHKPPHANDTERDEKIIKNTSLDIYFPNMCTKLTHRQAARARTQFKRAL